MFRLRKVPGSVSRLVEVSRDTLPLPGEPRAKVLEVEVYGGSSKTVAASPLVATRRWSRFLVDGGQLGDELLAALNAGPIKVQPTGSGAYRVDLDRIERITKEKP